ncbi:MAG: iron-containing alcohol dehydrogenase family protein [bacterium]|nr:iron-containing alcohol dehydrogenase family protein [bacterium]
MELYIPTHIYSEKECVKNHAAELAALGNKALIVTGKHSSRKNGSLNDVTTALKEQGRDYVIFDDIEENPSVETVMKAREFGLEKGVDYVIGVGGGSPMDAAKAIALMIANPTCEVSVLYEKLPLEALPVAEVPTTAGTGSEITPYAILTIHERRTKQSISYRIFPELALIDSKYLATTGHDNTVNTAVDTLAHLVESYMNTNSNSYNEMYARRGLLIWGQVKDALLNDRLSGEEYAKLSEACALGGMAITHTGTSLPHGLSYGITYELGVPHGKACGLTLAGYLRCFDEQEKEKNTATRKATQVLELLGMTSVDEFETYLRALLGSVDIPAQIWQQTVSDVMANQAKLKNYPYPITKEQLEQLLMH